MARIHCPWPESTAGSVRPPKLTWLDERDYDASSLVPALTDGGRPPDSARASPEATPDGATAAIEDVRFSESQPFVLPAGFSAPNWLIQDHATGALESFDFDGTTGAEIHGNVVTLHYVDGGRGDSDGIANGVIADPGGPGFDPANDAIAVWPIKYDPNAPAGQDHKMLTGFGDGSAFSTLQFHEGIDILASGQGGEVVVAARSGKVVEVNPDYQGGAYVIKVTLTDGSPEWDVYLHIDNLVQRNKDDDVNAYDQLGKISTTYVLHQAGSRHLHYMVVNQDPSPLGGLGGDIPETTILNPFLRFKDAADRDPWQNKPKAALSNDLNLSTFIVAPDGSFTPFPNNISGKVDIIVDAFDPMTSGQRPRDGGSGLYSIGYYIPAASKPPKPHGVKTSKDTAYILAKSDDNWFPGSPSAKFTQVYADSGNRQANSKEEGLRVKPNPYQFARNYHYIVTNTGGTDGSVANVSGAQNWNTKARERATPPGDDVADANYATDGLATNNTEARFMDGTYTIVAVMKDLNNTEVTTTWKRVVNFPRAAGGAAGGHPPPSGSPINTEDPDAVVSFDSPPPTSVAPMYTYEPLGTPIGISGEQFYPDWLMDAYIFPHRTAGWSEGDPLTGALNHSLVLSDSGGAIAVTASGWTANATGQYDVIIDYNNDGKFSYGLDGLGGFTVM